MKCTGLWEAETVKIFTLVNEVTLVTNVSHIYSEMCQTMNLSKGADKKKEQKSQMNNRPHAASA